MSPERSQNASSPSSQRNVVASFRSDADAERAVQELGRSGVDQARISRYERDGLAVVSCALPEGSDGSRVMEILHRAGGTTMGEGTREPIRAEELDRDGDAPLNVAHPAMLVQPDAGGFSELSEPPRRRDGTSR